jgi:iron complex outermembrane receptor protein
VTVGANNLFDIYPDKIEVEATRSSGRYTWSRSGQQFGIGGRFLFARLSIVL